MPFQIIRQDITRMAVDAIVNPTNERLSPDGGTDAKIHRAAGPMLTRATEAIGHLDIGTAVVTDAYDLPCRWVIHTAGPVWRSGSQGEPEALKACYQTCLNAALENQAQSLAFPLLSAGTYGFPRDVALRIGTDTIRDFLFEHEMDVFLVVYDPASYAISQRLYANVRSYLDAQALEEVNALPLLSVSMPEEIPAGTFPEQKPRPIGHRRFAAQRDCALQLAEESDVPKGIEEYLDHMGESFRDMLVREIKNRGMTDVQCYKEANVDRKLFSKIKNQPGYHAGKSTVLAFALALRLPERQIQEMLEKAGYTLSRSSRADQIVRYFISHGKYDVFEINETLFAFGEPTLGSSLT